MANQLLHPHIEHMPLSVTMRNVILTLACPHCGHSLVKTGAWCMVVSRYTCECCRKLVSFGYREKLALFQANAQLDKNCPRTRVPSRPLFRSGRAQTLTTGQA